MTDELRPMQGFNALSRARPPDDLPAPRAFGVAALLLAVADAVSARLGAVAVRGELSGYTRASSGHCYFQLKDSDGGTAVLRCTMFRRAAGLLDFSPADGQLVELRGRITVYEARGELQCVVESMQRLGAGSLFELFLRLKAKLEAAGLFDASRKRPLPRYPRTLGVVTSLGAAALHDVLTAIARRAPQVRVVVYPCLVQGPQAPAQIVQALAIAGQRAEVDALILCRGGGSLEDLWAFNDEAVVRAVADCRLPLVCGVGHETDVTLAELAADLRAPTPTAAAELATTPRSDMLQQLSLLAQRLQRSARHRMDNQAQRLDRLGLHMGRPARLLAQQSAVLDRQAHRLNQALGLSLARRQSRLPLLAQRLAQAGRWQVQRRADTLGALGLQLHGLDPQHVLARGYAWLADDGGRAVTRAADLRPGQQVSARWADGQAELSVLEVAASGASVHETAAAQVVELPVKRRRKPRSKAPPAD